MSFFMELCESLAEHGVKVTVFGPPAADPKLMFSNSDIDVVIPKTKPGRWSRLFEPLYILLNLRRRLKENDSSIVMGLSQIGLLIAWVALTGRRERLVYLNDELWFRDDAEYRLYPLRKCLERTASKRACLVVTQDAMRGRLLRKINDLPTELFIYMPNSRRGNACRRRAHMLHDQLGCPADTRIILWLGGVSEGDGALEVAIEAENWPQEYLFVTCFRSKSGSIYKQTLAAFDGKGRNRHIASGFSPADLEDAYASAFAGIVFYPKRSLNSEYIGASSGKLNLFLKAGVPCIVSPQRGLRWAVREAGCATLPDGGSIFSTIEIIASGYEHRSQCSIDAFNRRLAIDNALYSLRVALNLD